jgi:hypothetical protein
MFFFKNIKNILFHSKKIMPLPHFDYGFLCIFYIELNIAV